MKSPLSNINAHTVLLWFLMLAFGCAAAVAQTATQQPVSSPSAAPPENQKGFATPQLAAETLIGAAERYDIRALLEILGPEGKNLVESADPVRDKSIAQQFAAEAREKNSVSINNSRATLLIGNENWPVPIPIVRKYGKWYFDTKAGRQEILFRRIGANELDAIRICRGYVEAQKEYASTVHDDSGIHQ
jgi:Protein of unknown function (DUF2950)